MAELFISYSRKDKEFVRALHDALTEHGRDAWVDWEDIPLTADWQREIYEAIEAADTFIFVISPDSVASEVCALEVGHAVQYNKRLVPVYYRDVDVQQINPALRANNFIYLREQDDFKATIRAMIAALDTDLEYVKRHTRLLVRAIEWDNKKRDDSYVLRGADLREAESWLASSANKQPDPGELHLQYIAASRQAALARQRITVGSLAAGIVLAVILAALAFYQYTVAQTEADQRATAQVIAQNEADSNATAQSVARTQAAIALSEADSRATAEAVALRSADEAQSQALAAAAQLALNEDNAELAIALGLESTIIDDPPPSAQRTLAEAAYRPGVRRVILAHEEGVNSIALSSDGRLVASAGCVEQDEGRCSRGQFTLWDVATGERIRDWGDAPDYTSIAFSPDARYLASAQCSQTDTDGICIQGDVTLWNPQTGEAVQNLVGHSSEINQVTFSRDGTRLASAGDDGLVIWDVETGSLLRQMVGTGRVRSADFSPDGRFIVAGEAIQAVVYEVETGDTVLTIYSSLNEAVAYSPDGETIAIGSLDPDIVLINALDGSEIRRFRGHTDQVNTLAFSRDGSRLVSGAGGVFGGDRSIIVWDVESGVALERFEGHGAYSVDGADNFRLDISGVTRALLTPDGQTIISGGGDGTLRFWDAQNGAIIRRLDSGGLNVNAIVFSPDGRFIAAAGAQLDLQDALLSIQQGGGIGLGRGDVILWDAVTGSLIQRFSGHPESIFSLAFSPDGQYLASGSAAGDVIIWKVPSGDIVHRMEGHTDGTWGLVYSADGRYLVSGGFIGELFVWDAATGDLIRRLEDIGQSEVMRDLIAVGPHLYARYNQGGSDYALLKWNLETGALVSRLNLPDVSVSAIAISPDGNRLLVGRYDGTLRLYDVATGEPIGDPFVGHSGGVLNGLNKVTFSPDGRYALSGGYDTTVILWDIASGQALRRYRGHTGVINDLMFSPDGHTAISASNDRFVNLWRVDSLPELITWTYANRYVREVTCNERIQYRLSPACAADAPFPTRTPYPTLTPTQTFTPSPTVDLTRTTATPTPTITPTFTATPTASLTPSPTPTVTPEAESAISLETLVAETSGLSEPVTPLLPRQLPEGLQFFGHKVEEVEANELLPGGSAFMMIFSTDPNFSFDDPRQLILVVEMASPYADIRAWANESPLLAFINFDLVRGVEIAVMTFTQTEHIVAFVHEGRFIYLSTEGVPTAITDDFIDALVPIP